MIGPIFTQPIPPTPVPDPQPNPNPTPPVPPNDWPNGDFGD